VGRRKASVRLRKKKCIRQYEEGMQQIGKKKSIRLWQEEMQQIERKKCIILDIGLS
jgi:hypothetical protein